MLGASSGRRFGVSRHLCTDVCIVGPTFPPIGASSNGSTSPGARDATALSGVGKVPGCVEAQAPMKLQSAIGAPRVMSARCEIRSLFKLVSSGSGPRTRGVTPCGLRSPSEWEISAICAGPQPPRGAAAGRGPECGTDDDLCPFERITTQRRGRQTRRTSAEPTRRGSLFNHSRSAKSLTTCNDLSRVVEAVGIEQPGAHPTPTILERFRGQVSRRTRPKNASKTRYRTFL